MPFGKRRNGEMKATVYLRKDHELLTSLFAKYKRGLSRSPNGKKEAFEEIRKEIDLHSQMETEIFYPALENTTSTRARELVAAAAKDHRTMESVLEDLDSLNFQDKGFDAKVLQLFELIEAHIGSEEEEIFDEARKNLPEYRLEELGLEMEDRRKLVTLLAA
jgi:hemerythrin superfamily protein